MINQIIKEYKITNISDIFDLKHQQSILKSLIDQSNKAQKEYLNFLIYGKLDRKKIKCKITLGKE